MRCLLLYATQRPLSSSAFCAAQWAHYTIRDGKAAVPRSLPSASGRTHRPLRAPLWMAPPARGHGMCTNRDRTLGQVAATLQVIADTHVELELIETAEEQFGFGKDGQLAQTVLRPDPSAQPDFGI